MNICRKCSDCEHFRDASEFHAGDTCPFCDGKLYRDGEKLKCSEHCDFDKVIW